MQYKISLKWTLFAIGIVVMALSLIIASFPTRGLFASGSRAKPVSFVKIQISQNLAYDNLTGFILGSVFQKEESLFAGSSDRRGGRAGPVFPTRIKSAKTGTDSNSDYAYSVPGGAAALKGTVGISSEQQNLSAGLSELGLPVRLKIPKINVDAAFESVGLTQKGAMDVPKGPENVAWFNLGPIPGQNGRSVIAGHSGWKDNVPAVFDDLYKLRNGDQIYIENERGTISVFIVREIRTYGKNDGSADVFGLGDGKAHLNLITCGGVWDEVSKSSSDRIVVFADKE